MTLVPYTGWCCLNCGHRTDRGFPPISCCLRPLPARALIDETDHLSADERDAIAAIRHGEAEEAMTS